MCQVHPVAYRNREAQVGQPRIARAQVAADAGDEDHDQDGVEHEAHQQAQHIGAGPAVVHIGGQWQGLAVL